MSACGFRGRGFVRRSPRPNGPAGGFAGPRFPHPNFNHARPPPTRLPAPEKWGERPGGFPPWQANPNFQHRPQFRGNIHFRPNGRGRMSNGRGMVRFSGPRRPPLGPQFPVAPMRLPVMPRAPFVNSATSQEEKTIALPHPGSQEERQQKICETADKLKQKLSFITPEEIMHFWEDNFSGEQTNYSSEQEQQKDRKGVAELRHGPPELDLTFTDLRDIGRVDSNKVEGELCPEAIDLIDNFDNNASRLESTNEEVSITYSKDNDVAIVGSSVDLNCINPGAIEEKKSVKEPTSGISDVTTPYSVGSNEIAPCTSASASEAFGSFSNVLSETRKDTSVISTQAACKNVPETVDGQQLIQAKAFEETQKGSSIRRKAAKSPSVLQAIPLHKQKCISVTDTPSENAWSDTLPSPLPNNEDTIRETTNTSGTLATTYGCQPFSGLNYTEGQIPSGSGFGPKAHKELPSFAPRVLNSKYHWSSKASNRFPIGPPNKPEHSHQMPVLRPRMTTLQANPVTYSPRPLSSPLISNSVCSTDFPLNFDPAKPPPLIRPMLRSNNGNLETPVTFNTRAPPPHIPIVGNTMTDSLPSFNHQDSLPMYNHDDSFRPQQIYSPCGFLPEPSNLITINPPESVPMSLMDMSPVPQFSLDSTATNFVQLPSVPPSPRPSFVSNLQMNFPPVISNRGGEQISHNLQLPTCPQIEVPEIEAPPPLPEGLLSDSEIMDDPPEATINDGLEDMQEAMKFANQIMNMSEQMENSVDSEIPLPDAEPVLPRASPLNNECFDQSSLRITEALVKSENTSEEPKQNFPCIGDVSAEKTVEPENAEKTNQNQETNAQKTLPIDELMRPKIIFNLNSKSRRISIVEDWHHQNDEAKQKKSKATNQTSECKKVSRLLSLQTNNTDDSKEGDAKKKTVNKICNTNNQDTEVKKADGPRILNDMLVCRLSEKSRVSPKNVKAANTVGSQKPEKPKRGLKPVARTAELSWKNRVIHRFLKMSKNDICNMVNNSSLRKFDIAMKHLVKEKKSSLSLELRNTEDDKIKGYDQEEFMNQLNAMLDPSATVDITNLPTEFIHHLSEVLQLDPMPFETNNSIQSSTEPKEPFSSTQFWTHAASGNIVVDDSSLNSTVGQVESKNPKMVLGGSKDKTQMPSHNPSASDIIKLTAQQSPLVTEEMINETALKTQRPLFNAAELDNILSVVADGPKDCMMDMEEVRIGPLKDNTTLQSQPSVNDEPVKFPRTDDCNETIAMKKIVNPFINTTAVRPRKSTSEDRSTFKQDMCQRRSRKEREDLDAFRNLTKEEWEAKYGRNIASGSPLGSRRCFSHTRTDSFRLNEPHIPERRCLMQTSARNPSPSPAACEFMVSNLNRIPHRHNGLAEPVRATRSRSRSSSSSGTSSESDREPVNSDVTKLLKVIKEKENIAKTKSINATIRDEVAAEIERKRLEKTKYKEKKCSSKHSKRRAERRGKHKKRAKDKKKKKGSKNSSAESEDESSEEQRLLGEDEIKKEIVLKEEVLTSPEKGLPPNGVTVNSGTAARKTHNITGPPHVPQFTEPASELPPTAVLSAGTCSNDQQQVRNPSPCVTPTLHPKTKAQLKQMPEVPNVDPQCNTDQPCQETISIKHVVTINCEANKGIDKKIEEVQAEAERLKPIKSDQATVLDSAGQDNIPLNEGVLLPPNLPSGKFISAERSSSKIKSTDTNRIDVIPNSNLTPANRKMSKHVPSATKREKFVKVPNCGKRQKPPDASLHTVTQNMSKVAKSKPKKIDIKVYKERALQRRLREEGKLEEAGDTHGLIEPALSTSICNTVMHMSTDDSLIVKKDAYTCLPGTSKNEPNVTELSDDSNINDPCVPEIPASSTSLVIKNGSSRYTQNVTADNTSNSMKNSPENNTFQSEMLASGINGMLESDINVEYKATEEPKTISLSVGEETSKKMACKKDQTKKLRVASMSILSEATEMVEFKTNQTKKPKVISTSVAKESPTKVKLTKNKKKRQRRRNAKNSSNKGQEQNFNLSIARRTGTSANDVSEKTMVQEIESQVVNKLDNVIPIDENEVKGNDSNQNRITNYGDPRNESVVTDPKTESPDYLDSTTESRLQVLTPITINEAHVKYSDVEKEDRPIDVGTHINDSSEVSKELHFDIHANQELTSCIEEEQISSTSPETQCVNKIAPELILADTCTSFEQRVSESNEPSEIETKESPHNQLLFLGANVMKEEYTLQSNSHESITEHTTIDSNGAQSGDTNNDINADLKNVKEISVSHISNTKESITNYDEICNAISAESSSSPFAGFGQEWNQDCMYNEKISSLHYDEVDTQLPSPPCTIPDPSLTEYLHSDEPATLPRVTSEITIKTSSPIDGINDRSIFNEETTDTPSPSTKELSDNSNAKIPLEQACIRREYDLTLRSEIPTDPLNRDSNSYHVVSEYKNAEDDNIEQYPKASTFREIIKKNSCDDDELSKLQYGNFAQACIGSREDHDYSTNHQHVVNDTTNVDEQHYSRPTSDIRNKSTSANTVYTGDESQKNVILGTSLQEEHKEFNNIGNPTESGDLLTDITNETNTVERATTPLETISSEHDNSAFSNTNQEDHHQSFKALALDSSSCSMEVPKKVHVPTKAALKASGENIFASSATTSLNDIKLIESNTFEDSKRNSLFIEVRDLSKTSRAEEVIPEADDVHATDVADVVDAKDALSPGTERNKVEGIKQTHDRTHKSAGNHAKQSKGEQIDELHKIKSKPDLKRKHSKKQYVSEKTVSNALQSGLVRIGEPNTKESVMARMIDIDLQIQTLMNEKIKLYQLLKTDAVPSEATLQSLTPMPVTDEQCTAGPSGLASQLVQKIDMSAVLHQPVHKANEPIAQCNMHSTSSAKRKASARKEHSHRKRIALSYTSDEDDTPVSKKAVSSKEGIAESVESSSTVGSRTPERILEKKHHSEGKPSHGDGGKSSRHKVSTDITEEHSDRKLAKTHKPSSSDDSRRKTVSPNAEKKSSKKGHKDKPTTVKSVPKVETDEVKNENETEESDNNPSLISPKNESNKRTTDTCIPTHTRRESSSEKPEETKQQSTKVTNDNVPRQAQTAKSRDDISGNENKQTGSTRSISEARTSEGLSIYSDESTWESFPQTAPDESNDQKKTNKGLVLLEMSYKKEMAKSRKTKALTRKRKKKHSESAQTVNTLTSDEEELSLSTLYKKKLQQKRHFPDSMDSKVDDLSNLESQNNSQNLDEIINAVAEDRVQELYIEQQRELREKSDTQETKLQTEISKPNCDTREIQNDRRLKLQTLTGETERLKDDKQILIGKDNFELKITEKAAEELSLHGEQNIDLPALGKSADLSDNKINEDTHVDKHNSAIETQQDIEMPRLYPLNESSIEQPEHFSIGNFEQNYIFSSADELPQNASKSQESACITQSVATCSEKVKVNKGAESAPEEFISYEENKFDKFGRKKKNELVLEESFKPQRSRRDSAQSTDTMTTDSNSGTNQELSSRKHMKRKRKNNERSVRKHSRLTEENVKRIRPDIDASADSYPDTDTEGRTSATPIENKSLEKTSFKEIVSLASASRKRSSGTSKQQNSRKYGANAVDDDMQSTKQISSHKKQCDPRLYTQQLKDCEVRLVDSKYTLLKPNINPDVLRRYGISKINPYLENSDENPILSIQSSHADPVPDTRAKQNTSLPDENLINDTSEIQIIKNIAKQQDSSRIKQQNIENDIALVRDRRPSSGDEISVIPTRNLQTAIISLDSEVPDVEIVHMNPAKAVSEDGPEATLSVIEPNDDEDRGRTKYTVHKGPILDIKVFGNTFLAASEDGSIYRYSQASNGILNIYKGHKAAVTCLYVYSVGLSDSTKAWMFSGSLDGTLRCYNITTGMHIRDAVNVESPVQCLDEAWGMIFVGTKSGHVSRYHIKSGTVKGESIQFSDKSVLALKATNEGSRRVLIVASRNQPITIRDAQTGLFLRTISGQKSHTVYSLMRHNNLIYCGTSSTSIPVFDFTDGEEIVQYHAGVGIVCMRLYADLLFAGCYDGNIYIFNTKDRRLICSTPGPGNMLLSMEIVDNKIIAGSKDRRLQSWQMPKQVRSLLLRVT